MGKRYLKDLSIDDEEISFLQIERKREISLI